MNIFVEMIENVSYVENIEECYAMNIPEEHKAMVRERIEKYRNNQENYLEWDDIESKITQD